MKRKKPDSFEPEMSTRSARIVGGETSEPDDTSDVKKGLDMDTSELHFKKSVHGYNVEDVALFIDEQNKNYLSTCQMYEGKIAELRAEVAFLNRERDSLLSKYKESREEIRTLKDENEQGKQSEQKLQGEHQTLKEDYDTLKEECESLKEAKAESDRAAAQAVAAPVAMVPQPIIVHEPAPEAQPAQQIIIHREKNDDERQILVAEIALLRNEKAEAQSTIAQLAEIASGYEELSKQHDELKERYQTLTDELEQKNRTLEELLAKEKTLNVVKDEEDELKQVVDEERILRSKVENELKEKEALMSQALTEIEQLRKEITDTEIRQSALNEQIKKYDEEIAELREQNKRQAYDYASRVSELETEFNREKLAMQKQIQVHLYHTKQVDLLIDELQKQLDGAKNSLEVIDSSD